MFHAGGMKSCQKRSREQNALKGKGLLPLFLEPLSQFPKALFTVLHPFDCVLIPIREKGQVGKA